MCGLVGLYAKHSTSDNHLKLLRGLLFVDQIRGEHATGLAKVDLAKGETSIIKKAIPAHEFLGQEDVMEFMIKDRGRIWIGHNRWATMGDKTDDNNAHPFKVDHITLAHNGTVDRWTLKDLEGHADPACKVDSEMVARTIAKYGAREAITKKFSGAFALVWFDSNERTLNFIRNDKRPLHLASLSDGTLVWASQPEFIDFFMKQGKFPLSYAKDGEPVLIAENQLITFEFNQHGTLINNKAKITPLKFQSVPDPDPTPSYSYQFDGGGYRRGRKDDKEDDWYMGRRGSHVTTGASNYSQGITNALKKAGLNLEYGSIINFQPRRWRPFSAASKYGELGGVYGALDHEIIAYSVEDFMYRNNNWLQGRITSCTEVIDGSLRKLRIVVGEVGPIKKQLALVINNEGPKEKKESAVAVVDEVEAQRKIAEDGPRFPEGDPKAKWKVGTFPLKVDGHTFQSVGEFNSFVSRHCIECNGVPSVNNIYNPWMFVARGVDTLRLTDAEFICGKCSLISDQAQEEINKILEKHGDA